MAILAALILAAAVLLSAGVLWLVVWTAYGLRWSAAPPGAAGLGLGVWMHAATFDTADVYGMGHSEELIGRAFKGRRDEVIIASKVGNRVVDGEWLKDFSPEHIRRGIDDSLRRLQMDHVVTFPRIS